jgi:hypothetical protein
MTEQGTSKFIFQDLTLVVPTVISERDGFEEKGGQEASAG